MIWCLLGRSPEAPVFIRSPCSKVESRVWRRGVGGGSGAASSRMIPLCMHEHAKVEGLLSASLGLSGAAAVTL